MICLRDFPLIVYVLSTSMMAVFDTLAAVASPATHAARHGSAVMHFFFQFGLAGLPLISAVDSSFVPLPLPGITDILLIVYAAGHTNAFLLVLLATAGSAVGGFVSHAVGRAGGMAFLEKHVPARILGRVTQWVEDHAVLAIALPALLPPPMPLSPFVLVAGAVHMSRRKFMVAFTLSRLARHGLAVWIGIRYGRHFLRLWNRFSAQWGATILTVLWIVIVTFLAIAAWSLYKTSRELRAQKTSGAPGLSAEA